MILTCVHWKLRVLQKGTCALPDTKNHSKTTLENSFPRHSNVRNSIFRRVEGYMHTVSVSGKYDANSGVSPISQHLVPFILFDLLFELPASLVCIWWPKIRKKKKEQNKTNIPFWNAFRASLWPSFHYWKNCNQSNCNFCQRFFFFIMFQNERFTFSRDTRDDAVFTSLTGKIPQVNFTDSVFSF